ncbi:MAG: diphthine--ammonia ligase [Bacillota bacterium]
MWFVSWSGGKDSCLALWKARQEGLPVRFALTTHEGGYTAAHGLPLGLVRKQVESLGLELVAVETSWERYEEQFKGALDELASKGVVGGVFGDIDLVDHRDWVERVCAAVKMKARLPLWGCVQEEILNEFVDLGFRGIVISVDCKSLDLGWLGRPVDSSTVPRLIREAQRKGFSPCGEAGEYHTLVLAGPGFSQELTVKRAVPVYFQGHFRLEILEW